MSEFREKNAVFYKKHDEAEPHGLLYHIGNSLFFISLESIVDIINPEYIRAIPGGVDHFVGIFLYGESPRCFIDTHKRLGLAPSISPLAMLINTRNDGMIAFTIDNIFDIIPRHKLEIAPGKTDLNNTLLNQSLRAEYRYEGKRVLDVDLERLI
ncbi:MAG: chemotaxis protein CheW [Acidobacteria bacterium]|nr:chemotaxis protein CheW [Acidobacteriota bacterium]